MTLGKTRSSNVPDENGIPTVIDERDGYCDL